MAGQARSGVGPRRFRLRVGEEWFTVEVQQTGHDAVRVLVNDEPVDVELAPMADAPAAATPPAPVPAARVAPPPAAPVRGMADPKRVVAPMPGKVVGISVKPGDRVSAGDEICIMEAMKMQQSIRASADGVVKAVHVQPGQGVAVGALIVEME
jgi:biotin carboxyl carrier protein